MRKIVFIGAGSLVFTRNLVRDIMTFPAFDDCEIALVDIDEKRLGCSQDGWGSHLRSLNTPVSASTIRRFTLT